MTMVMVSDCAIAKIVCTFEVCLPCLVGGTSSMASGNSGSRFSYPSRCSLLIAPPPPSTLFLPTASCSGNLLELSLSCRARRRRRRCTFRFSSSISCMQKNQDPDEELLQMDFQRPSMRSDATPSTLDSAEDDAQASELELQCIGTGLDVECVIAEAHSKRSASATTNGTTSARSERPEMECIGTGTDVECVIPDSNGSLRSSKRSASRAATVVTSKAVAMDSPTDFYETSSLSSGDLRQPRQQLSSPALLKGTWEYLVLISPFFFWGTAMVAMKGVLPKAGPLFVAATRLIPSGFLLIAFARFQNRKQPSGISAWLAIALFALVDASCFQGFLAEGLKRTSAGLGSVIIDSQPLTVAILASILFGETIGALGVLGLATGIIGLLLLEVPTYVIEEFLKGHGLTMLGDSNYNSTSVNNWSIWESGEWWMLLAAQSMAVGTVMVRWLCQFADPVMATGWHMVLGGIPLLALAGLQHDPALDGHIQDLQPVDWLALLYTSLFGSAVSYGVFFYNASRGSLTKLSSLTFLTPVFAALFGYLLLQETLNTTQIVGASVTLASIYLINTKASSNDKDDTI